MMKQQDSTNLHSKIIECVFFFPEEGSEGPLIPRQHARLDSLLSQIPRKAQHGLLMQCDLILTCIDANAFFIALGTDVGLTFLYSRQDASMQRLRSEVAIQGFFYL